MDHPDTAEVIENLASLYQEQGVHRKAIPLYKQAIEITEKALGPNHPRTATSINNLASMYLDAELYEKAESLFKRALEGTQPVLRQSPPIWCASTSVTFAWAIAAM
jgi:tetratricopeptide (TPR) repeat protein